MSTTKFIKVEHGKMQELGRAMKVSQPTIRKALAYETNTERARSIRHVAVKEYGGKEYVN
ncbi:MAG: hypothetical protein J6T12_04565 [Salinivirgaceae bacterium]|jgi:hypothetical protein|nr:hypothetical protein [Salinivirgaceae bacterium]